MLVVNDEPICLEMISFKFDQTKKCKIDQAQNGFEAFDYVIKKFNAEP